MHLRAVEIYAAIGRFVASRPSADRMAYLREGLYRCSSQHLDDLGIVVRRGEWRLLQPWDEFVR